MRSQKTETGDFFFEVLSQLQDFIHILIRDTAKRIAAHVFVFFLKLHHPPGRLDDFLKAARDLADFFMGR